MAAEALVERTATRTSPKEVVRSHGLAFATDPLYRRVVYVNVVFIGGLALAEFLLDLPRALGPVPGLMLFLPLAVGQWRFWKWGRLDARTALTFVRLHRKAFKDRDHLEKLERPDVVRGEHFRVALSSPLTLGRTAARASYVYTITLTLGVIFSTLILPISLGATVTDVEFAQRSLLIALLTLAAAFTLGWIIPPIWLIEDAGVRYFSRRHQAVESVSRWFLIQLGPILGVGALGTFFLIYWVAGFTLVEAILALMELSFTLYPASLTAAFLYHKFREPAALEDVKQTLGKEGVAEFPSLLNALVKLPPK